MPTKRDHHFIPQFFLRGFTDPETPNGHTPFLWVCDIRKGAISKRAPQNVAAENGYYAVDTATGRDYTTVENELAEMESRAAGALRECLAWPIGSGAGIPPDVGTFFAWLGVRVPWFRRTVSEKWSKYLSGAAHGRHELPPDPDLRISLVNTFTEERRSETADEGLALIRSGT